MIRDINFHILNTDISLPQRLNCPFYYQPHPVALMAADETQQRITEMAEWGGEPDQGKMFGVLVVTDTEGLATGVKGALGYLMAYSGQIGGRSDWRGWVPAVFDYLQPDGYFVTHENDISQLNNEIDCLLKSPRYAVACARLSRVTSEGQQRIDDYRAFMKDAKARRDARRADGEENTEMIKESQYQKAELRRIKHAVAEEIANAQKDVDVFTEKISVLRRRRKSMSEDLQQWLFSQFVFLNAMGEKKSLIDIFISTTLSHKIGVLNAIPSGSGECCAPKLLQYAYLHGYTPMTMAEFWWGETPAGELREHLHYYPACQSKCRPILDFMLQGLDVEPDPLLKNHPTDSTSHLIILYKDDYLVAIDKPAGMLSVPGKGQRLSAIELLEQQHPELGHLFSIHRLDMQTSGILVFARSENMQRAMQKLFAMRGVHKTYIAILERNIDIPVRGTVNLPLAKDFINRPCMKVDPQGLTAVTDYQVVSSPDAPHTRLLLYPHTGRTHQLRIHCASPKGLGCPIVGDDLYGTHATRLLLHAEHLSFAHPVSQLRVELHAPCPF